MGMADFNPIAIAHNRFLTTPVPKEANRILTEFLWSRREEVDKALEPFGFVLADVTQPTFTRIVRVGDIRPVLNPEETP